MLCERTLKDQSPKYSPSSWTGLEQGPGLFSSSSGKALRAAICRALCGALNPCRIA